MISESLKINTTLTELNLTGNMQRYKRKRADIYIYRKSVRVKEIHDSRKKQDKNCKETKIKKSRNREQYWR